MTREGINLGVLEIVSYLLLLEYLNGKISE
jgi:hypothetical protein